MFVIFIVIFKGYYGSKWPKPTVLTVAIASVCRRLWRYVLWLNGAS